MYDGLCSIVDVLNAISALVGESIYYFPARPSKDRINSWNHYLLLRRENARLVRLCQCLQALKESRKITARSLEHFKQASIVVGFKAIF